MWLMPFLNSYFKECLCYCVGILSYFFWFSTWDCRDGVIVNLSLLNGKYSFLQVNF